MLETIKPLLRIARFKRKRAARFAAGVKEQ
jgi:hypothetical protein